MGGDWTPQSRDTSEACAKTILTYMVKVYGIVLEVEVELRRDIVAGFNLLLSTLTLTHIQRVAYLLSTLQLTIYRHLLQSTLLFPQSREYHRRQQRIP
jgi:hypothetical protein